MIRRLHFPRMLGQFTDRLSSIPADVEYQKYQSRLMRMLNLQRETFETRRSGQIVPIKEV